jgi:hypothetical protein
MRGMEWVGRRVFERGYWKSNDEKSKEAELLDASEGGEVTDGIIIQGEDEDKEGSTSKGTYYLVFFGEAFTLWLALRLHYQAKTIKLQNANVLFMK